MPHHDRTPLAPSAPAVEAGPVVLDAGGNVLAAARGDADEGGPHAGRRWAWSSAALGEFVVEPAHALHPRWLITHLDATPFGQVEVHERLLSTQVEVSDGREVHLTIGDDGTVRTHDGVGVARLQRVDRHTVVLDLDRALPAAWRTLLVAGSTLLTD